MEYQRKRITVILKTKLHLVILAVVISWLTSCSTTEPLTPSPTLSVTPVVNRITSTLPPTSTFTRTHTSTPSTTPTSTPTVTRTTTPSVTPNPTSTPTSTYLPITPVLQGTRLPQSGAAISVENADRLTLLARWGLGNPGAAAYTPDGQYFIVGASTGLYFYQPGDYALVHSIDTQAAISELAISPDSQVVAAVTADQVFIYQISDLRLISTIPAQANSVDFSPDGKLLALGIQGDPSNLQIRDAVTGEILQSFHNEQAAWAVKMSPRGDFIATGGFSTTIWALDGTIKEQNGPYVSGGSTYSVSFSPDGKFLAEGADYFLHIWRVLENGRLIIYRDIDLSRFDYSSVSNVAISPSGKLVAVTLSQGVYAWELATGACVLKIPTRFTLYSSLAWSADSQAISATSNEAGVQVWDVATGQSLASLNTHNGTFASLVWSPDGQKLAAGADEGTAYLFNVPDGAVIQRLGSGYGLNSLAFSTDGQNLAVGYNNRLVEIWDLGGTISQTLEGFGYGSSDATFSTDGSFFAASLAESWQTPPQVRFWNTRDWNVEKTFSVGDRDNYMITGFALAPDQSTGAIAYVDMRGYHKELIQIISVADEAVITYLEPKGKRYRVSILSMAYSPDGARLAVRVDEYVDPNPRLLVWQTSHWELLYEQSLVAGGLRLGWAANKQDSLAWSPDGKLLAVGMQDGSVQILEANSGKRLVNLTGHTLWTTGVAFSPDGCLLATCSIDGTIILWGIR